MAKQEKMRESTERQFKELIDILHELLHPDFRDRQYVKLIAKKNTHNQRVYAIAIYSEEHDDYALITAWGQVSGVKNSAISFVGRKARNLCRYVHVEPQQRRPTKKGEMKVCGTYVFGVHRHLRAFIERMEAIA